MCTMLAVQKHWPHCKEIELSKGSTNPGVRNLLQAGPPQSWFIAVGAPVDQTVQKQFETGSKSLHIAEEQPNSGDTFASGCSWYLRVVILSQKIFEKPSHNDTEGFEITFTGGFNTEFITENKTLELWWFFAIKFEKYLDLADFTAFWKFARQSLSMKFAICPFSISVQPFYKLASESGCYHWAMVQF